MATKKQRHPTNSGNIAHVLLLKERYANSIDISHQNGAGTWNLRGASTKYFDNVVKNKGKNDFRFRIATKIMAEPRAQPSLRKLTKFLRETPQTPRLPDRRPHSSEGTVVPKTARAYIGFGGLGRQFPSEGQYEVAPMDHSTRDHHHSRNKNIIPPLLQSVVDEEAQDAGISNLFQVLYVNPSKSLGAYKIALDISMKQLAQIMVESVMPVQYRTQIEKVRFEVQQAVAEKDLSNRQKRMKHKADISAAQNIVVRPCAESRLIAFRVGLKEANSLANQFLNTGCTISMRLIEDKPIWAVSVENVGHTHRALVVQLIACLNHTLPSRIERRINCDNGLPAIVKTGLFKVQAQELVERFIDLRVHATFFEINETDKVSQNNIVFRDFHSVPSAPISGKEELYSIHLSQATNTSSNVVSLINETLCRNPSQSFFFEEAVALSASPKSSELPNDEIPDWGENLANTRGAAAVSSFSEHVVRMRQKNQLKQLQLETKERVLQQREARNKAEEERLSELRNALSVFSQREGGANMMEQETRFQEQLQLQARRIDQLEAELVAAKQEAATWKQKAQVVAKSEHSQELTQLAEAMSGQVPSAVELDHLISAALGDVSRALSSLKSWREQQKHFDCIQDIIEAIAQSCGNG